MKKPTTISGEPILKETLNYDKLLEYGLEFAQRYSGSIWTDYNYHDPGVTFLEQLAYALTDLAYRTNFEMKDILLEGADSYPLTQSNLFHSPADIFPSDPLHLSDFRRLIIDQIKEVHNAWVIPVKDDPSGFNGLIDIMIQCREGLDEKAKEIIKEKVFHVYHQHRNLCNDLKNIYIMSEDTITFSAKISIDTDAMGEMIFASILAELDKYLNPPIIFQDPQELISKGRPITEVFTGPKPRYGYIDPETLPSRIDTIFISQIKDRIQAVPGVQMVENFRAFKNGIRIHDEIIPFESNRYPVTGNPDQFYLEIFKDRVKYEMDPVTIVQLYETLSPKRRNTYHKELRFEENRPRGRFNEHQLQQFYSIQRELPETYGLLRESLPSNANPKRRAQAKQLKAYLSFFDQIMANYLAQLVNTRKIFSADSTITKTYFSQYPEDIPEFDEVKEKDYENHLELIGEKASVFLERRNRILDHLMARFGEKFPAALLSKFHLTGAFSERNMISEEMIQAKIRFLMEIPKLGKSKGKGFNYAKLEDGDISGIENRLYLMLDIQRSDTPSRVEALLKYIQANPTTSTSDSEWKPIELITSDGVSINAFSLSLEKYSEDRLLYYTQGKSFLKQLFLQAHIERYYKVIYTKNNQWAILFTAMSQELPVVLSYGQNMEECNSKIQKAVERFLTLNKECEGFHLIEHILLRPEEIVQYRFNIFGPDGEVYISSYYDGELEEQKQLLEDVLYLGLDQANYAIVVSEDKTQFKVVLYSTEHEPVAAADKLFYSRLGAEKEIERAAEYIGKIQSGEINREEVMELIQSGGIGHQFPNQFGFSNEYTLVLPDWPARFQNEDFRKLLFGILEENSPLHVKINLVFLDFQQMLKFEEAFQNWKKEKAKRERSAKTMDLLSLQLIQMLLKFSKYTEV
jgi:hypothetical protein